MEKIYSRKDPSLILHTIFRKIDMDKQREKRIDISSENQYLQVASMVENKGKVFPAHKHKIREKKANLTQESLIIMKGSIKITYYDTNDELLGDYILREGDCSITFQGGHKHEILEDKTLFFEHKNGPYLGVENDKEFINDKKDEIENV